MHKLVKLYSQLKSQKKVLILGSAFVDVIVEVPQFPSSGSDLEATYKNTVVGGCAFNVADVLSKLKLEFDAFLPIGEGTMAQQVLAQMQARNLPIHKFNNYGDNGWCFTLVEPHGERTFISISGIETRFTLQDIKTQYPPSAYDICYLSGYELAQNAEDVLAFIESLSPHCLIVFDPGPRTAELNLEHIQRIEKLHPLYTINVQEAFALCQSTLLEINDLEHRQALIQKVAKLLVKRTQNAVVISDGAYGAYLYADSNIDPLSPKEHFSFEHIEGFKVNVVDTIGSGDSHTGGILAGLMSGFTLNDSVLLANKIASIVSSHQGGATAPTKDELIQEFT